MVTDVSQLPEIDSSWVRTYNVDRDGIAESFSVLEAGPLEPRGTIVCVHGNPTWSFMWRNFVRELSTQWRVIAIDQLGMGFRVGLEKRAHLPHALKIWTRYSQRPRWTGLSY